MIDIYACCLSETMIDVFKDRKIIMIWLLMFQKIYNRTHFGYRTNLFFDDFFQKCSFSFFHECKQRNSQCSLVIQNLFLFADFMPTQGTS